MAIAIANTPAVVFFSAELQSNLVTRSFLTWLGYDSSSGLLTLSIMAQCTEYLAFTTVDDFYVVDENDFDALLGVPWVESCRKKLVCCYRTLIDLSWMSYALL